jgi:RimJ/RimL family protein N-acetyltransferase
MQLTLSKSTIRSLRPTDAAAITKHVGTQSVARNMSTIPHPYAQRDAEEWLASLADQPETNFAITVDDEAVGVIGVHARPPELPAVCHHDAEIGYWLGETFWGRGIMTEAVLAMTEWAFAHFQLIRLHAAVFARNPASARVLEKAGYAYEGRLRARYFRDGEYIDGLLYARVRLPG